MKTNQTGKSHQTRFGNSAAARTTQNTIYTYFRCVAIHLTFHYSQLTDGIYFYFLLRGGDRSKKGNFCRCPKSQNVNSYCILRKCPIRTEEIFEISFKFPVANHSSYSTHQRFGNIVAIVAIELRIFGQQPIVDDLLFRSVLFQIYYCIFIVFFLNRFWLQQLHAVEMWKSNLTTFRVLGKAPFTCPKYHCWAKVLSFTTNPFHVYKLQRIHTVTSDLESTCLVVAYGFGERTEKYLTYLLDTWYY